MGEHKRNPVALANRQPQQVVGGIDIGEGLALIGLQLQPLADDKGNLHVGLFAVGGRVSDLVPLVPVQALICELATATLESIRNGLRRSLGEEPPKLETA